MSKKTAGKLNLPPPQDVFDSLPMRPFCRVVTGRFYRLHSTNPATGTPWGAMHFSKRGRTRFDPADGLGTLCLGATLGGALMELFDDYWGPWCSIGRSITEDQLRTTWVSGVAIRDVLVFEASGGHLSQIGTDAQLLTGDYATTQQWALRLMQHPAGIEGIGYQSRHDPNRANVAVFERATPGGAAHDPALPATLSQAWTALASPKIVYGLPILLAEHPELDEVLVELAVKRLP
jgi:hypothetical protein